VALFYCHKAANSGLSHHRKAISNKNVQNRPESEQFREMLGVFYFQKQIRKPGAGKEVMQMPRMPKYLKREWAFFLGDCGRKKYNPL
jgi:predicted nucleotidyltransferase